MIFWNDLIFDLRSFLEKWSLIFDTTDLDQRSRSFYKWSCPSLFAYYYYGSFFCRGREQREARTTREREACFAHHWSPLQRGKKQTHTKSKWYVHSMWSFCRCIALLHATYHAQHIHLTATFLGVSYFSLCPNNQPLRWTSFFLHPRDPLSNCRERERERENWWLPNYHPHTFYLTAATFSSSRVFALVETLENDPRAHGLDFVFLASVMPS